ncbi:phosphatidylinositol N-acetylglucosaminyltransferase [Favolaschia claudopus]|uniref:Phosphatidylinositol N-acetylglucosaminyltransferase n=1 Tax=Favolaschia claudopus TaxID=2862362 RepID=A0AAW0EHJ4_9AGAR
MSKEWEKVLWKKQAQPDNYVVPGSFLRSLRRNANFRPYTYWPLVLLSCTITQHLATIFIFVSVFVRLKQQSLHPPTLIWVSIACFSTGYLFWELLDTTGANGEHRRASRIKTVKSSILIFLALMSLSPVLKTLTAATSSDSIWALSAVLFGVSALLADYSAISRGSPEVHERLTSVLSINAAISASVVLASRLADDLAVFALVLFSVQAFALFPRLRRRLGLCHPAIRLAVTIALFSLSVVTTWSLSLTVTRIYSAVQLGVTFVAPAFLVWAQNFKNEIRGPWDVAVPKVNL